MKGKVFYCPALSRAEREETGLKKNTKRILSLLLVLMMVVSLFPSAYAAETEDPFVDEGYGSSWEDWDDQPAEEVAPVEEEPFAEEPVEEPAPVEEPVEEPAPVDEPVEAEDPFIEDKPAVSSPANSFYYVGGNGLRVTVDAPEGAFPVDAEMVVTEVPLEEVQAKIDDSEFAGQTAVVATDISFYDGNGAELQPGVPVSVSIRSDLIPAVEDPMVLHIADDGRIDMIGQQATRNAVMATASVQSTAGEQAETLNVSFQASSFSQFTVTSRTYNARRATVKYVDESGNELTVSNTVFPSGGIGTSGSSPAFLIYDIDGYEYSYTYRNTNTTANRITPMLVRSDGRWYYRSNNSYPGNNGTEISNNDVIYVVYKPKTQPTQGGKPSIDQTETWPEGNDAPQFSKSSVYNKDTGTNTVTLKIKAAEKPVTKTTPADVIVVFDVSGSMGTSDMSGTRLAAAKSAANTMADTLLNGENTDVRMALISFATGASIVQGFTNNYNTFRNAVNGLNAEGGTNWELSLKLANEMEVRSDAATFVVFITDGDPTYRLSRGNVADGNMDNKTDNNYSRYRNADGYGYNLFGTGNSDPRGANFDTAVKEVSAIAGANKNFYAIGISNDVTKVQNLTTQGGVPADHAFIASNKQAMDNAFKSITESIKSALGFGDVNINDGITELTNADMKVMESVDPKSFKYYRFGGKDNKYGADEAHKQEWTTREADGCNPATYDESTGAVQWNMGAGFQLEDGVTYLVSFRVWPSQDAYNLVADLNNNIKTYDSLSDAEKAQVVEVEGDPVTYALKTNTDQVYATYKKTTKTGSTVTISDDHPIDATYTPGTLENMALESMLLTVKKEFEDDLTAGEDRETQVVLVLQRRDAHQEEPGDFEPYEVLQNGEMTSEIVLNEGNGWKFEFYVAPGFESEGEVLEHGYDFTITEPDIDYHYGLIEEIINPMVVDGKDKYYGDGYLIDDDETISQYVDRSLTAVNRVKSGIDVKKVVKDVDDNIINNTDTEFTIHGKLVDADGNGYTFNTAWDNRPDKSIAAGASAEWQAHQNDSGAYHYYDKDGKRIGYKLHVADTADFTITLKAGEYVRFINVPDGSTFEFSEINLPEGYASAYGVDATTQHRTEPGGPFTPEGDVQPTVSDGKASLAAPGVVGNKQYSVTFTNQMTEPQVFYVYHSSNKMVEKIALSETDPRLTAEKDSAGTITGYTFNIANEVISGNIYGGYYKAYATDDAGIDEADAAVRGLTYTSADPGKGYTYATKAATTSNWATDPSRDAYTGVAANEGAWDGDLAYTESGLAMSPVVDTVYYLKEVPDMYLAPATYVVYDNNAGVFNSDKNATFYPVKQIHLISFTDDKNYKSVGFTVNANPKDLAPTTVPFWGTEITIQKMGTTTDTIDVTNRLYKDHIGAVVLQCADSMMQNNAYYREIPYQITLDGVKVTSIRQMTVLVNDLTFNPPEGSNPGWIKPGMTKATVAKKPEVAVQ